ncbi:hypothetical protein Tsubulata_022581 [Turnera subulata]|uniref:CSN8/PSMD8/EIF3K domain-containing protein n=1 Tax=Turnera subulata TaxID=218843 RepID=A0A9Q0FZY6_9ROSI|nr:hypothetical protein Tsubulata_022581 [Turnera subulata]
MDFTPLTEALASKSYEKIADISDKLMLKALPSFSFIIIFFFVLLRNSARFLWKSIPSSVKENRPELAAVWKIGQKRYAYSTGSVEQVVVTLFPCLVRLLLLTLLKALTKFETFSNSCIGLVDNRCAEVYTRRMFQLLVSAYSTISVQDTALFLGMSEDDAKNYAVQQGWIVDLASQMLTVKKQPIVTEQKLDASKLQRLTEYVFQYKLKMHRHYHNFATNGLRCTLQCL